MNGAARLTWAFLRRDFRQFRLSSWLLQMGNAVLSVLVWYYVSRMVTVSNLVPNGDSPMDYFTFSLIGLALTQYVWRGFSAFSTRVQAQHASGGLEILWGSPYPIPLLFLFTGLWDFLLATLNAAIILTLGACLFGAGLTGAHILGILGVGGFAALSMGCLGLFSAGWAIAFGGGDAVRPLLGRAMPFLSGAFFPVAMFPAWVKGVAFLVPLTHALVLARGVAVNAASARDWGAMAAMTAGLMAAAWGALHLALRQARRNGRLARV